MPAPTETPPVHGQHCCGCMSFQPIGNGQGACRAKPPTVFLVATKPSPLAGAPTAPGTVAAWPTVMPDHWCREFEPRLAEIQ